MACTDLIAIMGTTASGKSDVAEALADSLGLQLINADAFMVYRGMNIGTNKPARKSEYELIDVVDPDEEFGVGEWIRLALPVLEALYKQGRGAVVVGGTGLYVRALFEEYSDLKGAPDPMLRKELERRLATEGLQQLAQELSAKAPETARATDLKNPVRVLRALERFADPRPPIQFKVPPFKRTKFVLDRPVEKIDEDIAARVDAMFDAGWENEVRGLLNLGYNNSAPGLRAIGYECVVSLVEGRIGVAEAKLQIISDTRQYARRQRTWLRSEPGVRHVHHESARSSTEAVIACL